MVLSNVYVDEGKMRKRGKQGQTYCRTVPDGWAGTVLQQGRILGYPSRVRWAGTVFEVTSSFGQEQRGQRPLKPNKRKCDRRTDGPTKRSVESRSTRLHGEFNVSVLSIEEQVALPKQPLNRLIESK